MTDQLQQPVGIAIDNLTGSPCCRPGQQPGVPSSTRRLPASYRSASDLVVVRAATLLSGPVAPGSPITVFGADLTNVHAYFDGIQAHRLAISDTQFNVQVPLNATGAFELRSTMIFSRPT